MLLSRRIGQARLRIDAICREERVSGQEIRPGTTYRQVGVVGAILINASLSVDLTMDRHLVSRRARAISLTLRPISIALQGVIWRDPVPGRSAEDRSLAKPIGA